MAPSSTRDASDHFIDTPELGRVSQSANVYWGWDGSIPFDGREIGFSINAPMDTPQDIAVLKPTMLALCKQAGPLMRAILDQHDRYRSEVASAAADLVQDYHLPEEGSITPQTLSAKMTLDSLAFEADTPSPREPLQMTFKVDAKPHPYIINVDIDDDLQIGYLEAR